MAAERAGKQLVLIGKHHKMRMRACWACGTGYTQAFLSWTLQRAEDQGYDLGPNSPLIDMTMKELDWLINTIRMENPQH